MYKPKRTEILQVPIDDISLDEALRRSEAFLRDGGFHHVVTPGPEFVLEATAHPEFKRVLQKSDLSIPDGMGLKVGSLLRGPRIHHRVAGADYVRDLLSIAARDGYTVFFLGAAHGIAEQAYVKLKETFPNLKIAGTESLQRGLWGRVHDRRVLERIHLAKPDILLVALGFPRQDLWIAKHRHHLHDVRLAVGVGRTLDYFAGSIARSPAWMRKIGFEWLGTWLNARQFHQSRHRRKRVWNALWHYPWTRLTRE